MAPRNLRGAGNTTGSRTTVWDLFCNPAAAARQTRPGRCAIYCRVHFWPRPWGPSRNNRPDAAGFGRFCSCHRGLELLQKSEALAGSNHFVRRVVDISLPAVGRFSFAGSELGGPCYPEADLGPRQRQAIPGLSEVCGGPDWAAFRRVFSNCGRGSRSALASLSLPALSSWICCALAQARVGAFPIAIFDGRGGSGLWTEL